MRIFFINLHCNEFLVHVLRDEVTNGHSSKQKRRYLLDYMIHSGVEVVDLVTIEGTTLPTKLLRSLTSSFFHRIREAKMVFRHNGIPEDKIKITTRFDSITSNDVVILFGHFGTIPLELSEIKCKKIVDQIHFYGCRNIANIIKKTGANYYFFDVDLYKYSKLFQRNYKYMKDGFLSLPLAFAQRFQEIKPFRERHNKAVAMGTTTCVMEKEYYECYGTYQYQPLRQMIYEEAPNYRAEIDSYISKYEDDLKDVNEKDPWIVKKGKYAYNLINGGKQKKYYSFDMVEKYNDYQMFICPEDINGSPGVGTFEGMACGCALLGNAYGGYEDLGLVAGESYIQYNGTMKDLAEKIRYYQNPEHINELECIARKGTDYVRRKYNETEVAKRCLEILNQ